MIGDPIVFSKINGAFYDIKQDLDYMADQNIDHSLSFQLKKEVEIELYDQIHLEICKKVEYDLKPFYMDLE